MDLEQVLVFDGVDEPQVDLAGERQAVDLILDPELVGSVDDLDRRSLLFELVTGNPGSETDLADLEPRSTESSVLHRFELPSEQGAVDLVFLAFLWSARE